MKEQEGVSEHEAPVSYLEIGAKSTMFGKLQAVPASLQEELIRALISSSNANRTHFEVAGNL